MHLQFLAPILAWAIIFLAIVLIDMSFLDNRRKATGQKLPMVRDLIPFFVILFISAIAGSVYMFLQK